MSKTVETVEAETPELLDRVLLDTLARKSAARYSGDYEEADRLAAFAVPIIDEISLVHSRRDASKDVKP